MVENVRKLPVVVQAIQWTGTNLAEVLDFTGKHPKWNEWFPGGFEEYAEFVMQIDKNTDLKIGSIVRLKGGGPLMTVVWIYDSFNDKPLDEKIPNDQFVRTMWFDQNDILHESKFNIKTLVIQ